MSSPAQTGTTGAAKVQELYDEGKIKEAVILDGLDTCMMQLINGDVSAVINDKPVTETYMKKQPDKIKMVGEALTAESYGFAIAKGNEALLQLMKGKLDKLVVVNEYHLGYSAMEALTNAAGQEKIGYIQTEYLEITAEDISSGRYNALLSDR